MNPEKLFEESYERIIGSGVGITEKGDVFFTRFYEIFLGSSEKVATKFNNTDMDGQIKMLQKAMYQLISFYLLKSSGDYLHEIASSHSKHRHNINPEFYDLWLSALLQTVSEIDPEYTPELKLAWEIVMSPGILYLKHHYDLENPEGDTP